MVAAGNHHRFVGEDRIKGEFFLGAALGADDHVQVPGSQLLAQHVVLTDYQLECDLWRAFEQCVGQFGQQVFGHGRRTAQTDIPYRAAGEVAHLALGLGDALLQDFAPRLQQLAHWRELDSSAIALEQPGAKRFLQTLNAFGQRRLAAIELFSGAPQMTELGDGFKIGQVTQVHISTKVINS
jgi:hypothetical protein